MRIAIIAPPFISVPPKVYGGTELFVAELATGLKELGMDVVVYANGESTLDVEVRALYPKGEWPIKGEIYDNLKDVNHTSWAVRDAAQSCDLIHINNVPGLACSRFVDPRFVYTIHHPHLEGLSAFYQYFPEVNFVTISDFQRRMEKMPHIQTIHHGIDMSIYELRRKKQHYLSFLGRIAPIKGTHLAIQVAKGAGIPLKIAGEVQPLFRDYFEQEIKPHIDGKAVEFIGSADIATKNELLGNSLAMLFPIQWDEPFGLVMLEAMACGTPVLALPGGAVEEVVLDGTSGFICHSVQEMTERARNIEGAIPPATIRQYVSERFSLERMVSQYAKLYDQILAGTKAAAAAEVTEIPVKNRAIA